MIAEPVSTDPIRHGRAPANETMYSFIRFPSKNRIAGRVPAWVPDRCIVTDDMDNSLNASIYAASE
ncbi:hypothetical protein ACFQ1A_15065 [Massilia pinisoli]|uniref:hypothetical protein n=1 Tax=Massilia pinisoli TaxID=1772194 RepID=UPI00363DDA38